MSTSKQSDPVTPEQTSAPSLMAADDTPLPSPRALPVKKRYRELFLKKTSIAGETTPVSQQQHDGASLSSVPGSPRLPLQNQISPQEVPAKSLSAANRHDHRDARTSTSPRDGVPLVDEKMQLGGKQQARRQQLALQLSQHAEKMSYLGLNSPPRTPRTRRTEGLDEIYDTILGSPTEPHGRCGAKF
ncbi:unnamed protein product [Calypogeia fissa]